MPGLPKQTLSTPFLGGADTKTDPKQIEIGQLAVCENFDFESLKQLIQKKGHATRSKSTVTGGSVGDQSTAIVSRNGQAALLTSDALFADTGSTWAAASGHQARFSVTKRVFQAFITNDPYVAYTRDASNEYFLYADGAAQAVLEARSISTGARVFRVDTAATKSNSLFSWLFVQGGYLVALIPSGFSVNCFTVNLSTYATASVSVDAAAGAISAASWRSSLVIGTVTSTGGVRLYTSSAPFTTWTGSAASYPAAASGTYRSLAIAPYLASSSSNDKLFVFTGEGSSAGTQAINFRTLNASLASVSSAASVDGNPYSSPLLAPAQVAFGSTDVMTLTYSTGTGGTLKVATFTGAGALVGDLGGGYDSASSAYLPALSGGSWFSDYLHINPHPVAESYLANRGTEHFPSLSVGQGTLRAYGAFSSDGDAVYWAGTEQLRAVGGGYYETALAVYGLTLDTTSLGPPVEVNQTLYFLGAGLYAYDGAKMFEGSFVYRPKLTMTSSTTGGSIGAGTYSYVAVFEWFDANGNLYRSAPSDPVSVTTTGSTSSAHALSNTLVSTGMESSGQQVTQVLYRTENAGAIYYRVGSVTDTLSDSSLRQNEILYTTGGYLESSTAPASTFALAHQNRVFLVDAEDLSRVAYSKKIASKTAPEFNEDLEIRVPAGEGGLVALGSLDDKLCFFKRSKLFYTVGDGPTDNGTQNTFTEPQRIETDVGCVSPRAIANTSEGILFKSDRGWYLLTRGLQVVYVGAPVERYNDETPVAALLVTSRNQVRIYHASGVILVYNYMVKQWAVHSIGSAIQSAALVNGSVWVLTDEVTQRLLIETEGQWLDGSSFNEPRIVTAWIAMAQVEGFQRIYEASFFGELRGAHTLRIRVGYDYDPLWKEEHTIASATALTEAATLTDASYYGSTASLGGTPAQILQYKVKPYIQKCQAIRFEITVLNPSVSNAELARLSGMAITVGLKGKLHRTGSAQVAP